VLVKLKKKELCALQKELADIKDGVSLMLPGGGSRTRLITEPAEAEFLRVGVTYRFLVTGVGT
jgi:hypothetical protein